VQRSILVFIIYIILSGLVGCNKTSLGKFDEGEIHYRIVYNNHGGTIPMDLMPNSMVVKFKDDKTLMEITAPIGNNGIFNLTDPGENTISTYVRFLNIKYYFKGETGLSPPGVDPMEDLKLEKTGDIKVISGLNCKHVLAKLPGYDHNFDLWYTNEIDIDDPNNSTPFRDIDGVLLKFFYKMGDMIIEFEATNVYEREVPDKEFHQSDKFLRISREDMDRFISKMMAL
jgi:hypothetical protein